MPRPLIDATDIRILKVLQHEGRISNRRLSEKVGLSERACLDRLRRLEAEGVIRRYVAVVDRQRLGGSLFFAEIMLKDHSAQTAAAFERAIAEEPEVVDCALVDGQSDYLARIACRDAEHYRLLTQRWIDDARLGIARINSRTVLKTVRDFAGYAIESLPPPEEMAG